MRNKLAVVFVRAVSVFFRALGWRACRFAPSCSEYASQAFGEFGFLKAAQLSAHRLFRCHPFCEGGYDPLIKERI